jgi:hypothetical protein
MKDGKGIKEIFSKMSDNTKKTLILSYKESW